MDEVSSDGFCSRLYIGRPVAAVEMEGGQAVVPVFIWSPEEERPWEPGGASKWWLPHSLTALDDSLRRRGVRLTVRRGGALKELARLIRETEAKAVHFC